MRKIRLAAIFTTLIALIQLLTPFASAAVPPSQSVTQPEVTDAIYALRDKYPDGMTWTNQTPSPGYRWVFPGSLWNMGGCAAFAAIIQDETFGSYKDVPPALQMVNGSTHPSGIAMSDAPYRWETLWPGDIIRFSGHSVIVVEKDSDSITIAEGNSGGKVRWGRVISKESVEGYAQYVITRYSKTEPLMPYLDMPNKSHWSFSPIAWGIMNDYASPVSSMYFGASVTTTRADMVMMLWSAFGRQEPQTTTSHFTDVASSAPYAKAVYWALEEGITAGTSSNTFSPDGICTRAMAMTFLWRAVNSPIVDTENNPFEDLKPEKYYFMSVSWAHLNGVTSGTSSSTFSPGNLCTRAEAIAFIYHVFGK